MLGFKCSPTSAGFGVTTNLTRLMVKPCGLTSALVVVELFPPESFSMKVWQSIDWVARHMIEMCALEGKHLSCINGETLETSEKIV